MLRERACTLHPTASSENAGGWGPVTDPHLCFAAALQRILRSVDRIKERQLFVELRAVDCIAEPDDPSRIATSSADFKGHDGHWLLPLPVLVDRGNI